MKATEVICHSDGLIAWTAAGLPTTDHEYAGI